MVRRAAPFLLPLLSLALCCLASTAGAISVREIHLSPSDVVYNPHDGFLYASVPGTSATSPNSVVRIDPVSGGIGPAVAVGSEPRDLALSDDGVTLYVGLDGAGAVRRVDLSSMTAGLQFSLGSDPFLGTLYAEDIEVIPGNPNAIAVSLRNQGYSPRHMGVAIFDDGVARATRTATHTGSNVIAFGSSASRLYGYNNESTESGFRRMDVTASGVTVLDVTNGLISGNDFEYSGGRVYSTGGRVSDPETRTVLGTFPLPDYSYGGAVAPAADRVYMADWDFYSGRVRLHSFDPSLFITIDRYPLAGVTGTPSVLHVAGNDRLVLLTSPTFYQGSTRLWVLDGVNEPPTCDLALAMGQSPARPTVGNGLSLFADLRNRGEAPAEQVTLRASVPPALGYQYASAPAGGCYDSAGTVVCTLPPLLPGDSIRVTIQCAPQQTGTFQTRAAVASATKDLHSDDNEATLATQVLPEGADRVNLFVRFAVEPESVAVEGRPFRHRLEIGNQGPAEATNVSLAIGFWGDSLRVLELLAPGMTCEPGTNSCHIASLPVGTVVPVDVTFMAPTTGSVYLSYWVSASEIESDFTDNGLYRFVAILPSVERLLAGIGDQVRELGLHAGPERTLLDPLQDGIGRITAGDTSGCCEAVATFRQRLDQRTGRALTIAQAYGLFVPASVVQFLLACDRPATRAPEARGGARPADASGTPEPGEVPAIPGRLELSAAGGGWLRLALPAAARVHVDMIDVQGRVVGVVFDGELSAGTHTLDPANAGRPPVPGVYLYRLSALGQQRVVKLASLR